MVACRDWQKAIADYSKAIELKSDYAPSWYARGCADAELKQWDKACGGYRQGYPIEPLNQPTSGIVRPGCDLASGDTNGYRHKPRQPSGWPG